MKSLFQCSLFFLLFLGTAFQTHAEPLTGTDAQIRTEVDSLLDNILEGMKTKNYTLYSRDLDDLVKEAVTEVKFPDVLEQINKAVGQYQSRIYLGSLNQGQSTLVLWKGHFAGTPNDVLIRLSVSKRDNKYKITGLWFQ